MPCIYIPYSDVSTHSRPKAAGGYFFACADTGDGFNTQPPEGGWNFHFRGTNSVTKFQHTAARRRLDHLHIMPRPGKDVSTHSRPKAAGTATGSTICAPKFQHTAARRRLEGLSVMTLAFKWFQHTAARRRLDNSVQIRNLVQHVSTHSRPKAAGNDYGCLWQPCAVSTHSRPKAAGLGDGQHADL